MYSTSRGGFAGILIDLLDAHMRAHERSSRCPNSCAFAVFPSLVACHFSPASRAVRDKENAGESSVSVCALNRASPRRFSAIQISRCPPRILSVYLLFLSFFSPSLKRLEPGQRRAAVAPVPAGLQTLVPSLFHLKALVDPLRGALIGESHYGAHCIDI